MRSVAISVRSLAVHGSALRLGALPSLPSTRSYRSICCKSKSAPLVFCISGRVFRRPRPALPVISVSLVRRRVSSDACTVAGRPFLHDHRATFAPPPVQFVARSLSKGTVSIARRDVLLPSARALPVPFVASPSRRHSCACRSPDRQSVSPSSLRSSLSSSLSRCGRCLCLEIAGLVVDDDRIAVTLESPCPRALPFSRRAERPLIVRSRGHSGWCRLVPPGEVAGLGGRSRRLVAAFMGLGLAVLRLASGAACAGLMCGCLLAWPLAAWGAIVRRRLQRPTPFGHARSRQSWKSSISSRSRRRTACARALRPRHRRSARSAGSPPARGAEARVFSMISVERAPAWRRPDLACAAPRFAIVAPPRRWRFCGCPGRVPPPRGARPTGCAARARSLRREVT